MLGSFGLCSVESVGSQLGTWVLHVPRGWTPMPGWAPGSSGSGALLIAALGSSLEPLGFSAGLIPHLCWGWDQKPMSIPSTRLSLRGAVGSLGGSSPRPLSPHPCAGWRHGLTVSDERGFASRGWAKAPPGQRASRSPPPGTLPQGTKLEGIRTYRLILPARCVPALPGPRCTQPGSGSAKNTEGTRVGP